MAGDSKQLTWKGLTRRTVLFQVVGFGLVIALLWLNEWLDLPHLLLGAERTPVNWRESILETVVVAIIGGQTCAWMYEALRSIRYLEGLLVVCANCNKIRAGDQWVPMHAYVTLNSDASFSHGVCPDCDEKLCGTQKSSTSAQRDKQAETGEAG